MQCLLPRVRAQEALSHAYSMTRSYNSRKGYTTSQCKHCSYCLNGKSVKVKGWRKRVWWASRPLF